MIEKLKLHHEFIFAATSGVFILIAWLLAKIELETASIIFYLLSFLIGGYAKGKEGIGQTIKNKDLNVDILMIIAAVGAAAIGYWEEGAMLIFIFSMSGAMETYTMNKSHKEISALMKLQPEEALRITNGEEKIVPVAELEIGDMILIKPGVRIAADGKICQGETNIDEAAITGEPIPNEKGVGDEVFAGTVNLRGAIEVEITKRSDQTLFQKIIRLVQNAQSEKSPSQLFIEKFEGLYVKCVLGFVALLLFLPHFLFGWSWELTVYRAIIILVVASPCALVASITPATLSAISNGAKKGILFKGGVQLERLASLSAIAFDKTGTLTTGKPSVTDVYVREGRTEQELLEVTASIESHSTHPLADAIIGYAEEKYNITPTKPKAIENVAGFGVRGELNNTIYQIGKADFIGEDAHLFQNGIATQLSQEGKTIVYIGDNEGVLGLIALKDTLRAESVKAIENLQQLDVKTVMITGDNEETAKAIAKEGKLSDYFSSCLPEEKVSAVKGLIEKYGTVAMVGDGINDAPALATATVGIAMGEGTDVALETADVVLMKSNLNRLPQAIHLSKRLNKIVKQNIVFALGVIVVLIFSNFLFTLPIPLAVVGHEGSTILVILNGLRLLRD